MERFLAFAGDTYGSPDAGGWRDLVGIFGSADESRAAAIAAASERSSDSRGWWHVVDLETGRIVESSEPDEVEQS